MRTGRVELFVFFLVTLSVVGVAFVGIIVGVGLGEIVNQDVVGLNVGIGVGEKVNPDFVVRLDKLDIVDDGVC